jgi:hypothetical protein
MKATLRDQFAMAAMSGMTLPTPIIDDSWSKEDYKYAVAAAYTYADKMMEYHRIEMNHGD